MVAAAVTKMKPTAKKRKRVVLTVSEKLEVLALLDQSVSYIRTIQLSE